MLQDNYGRKFQYLRLSITDVCNFRCDYCLPDGYQCDTPRDFLSHEEIAHLVTAFAAVGTQKVRITGGEPSLRKDLPDIIRACKGIDGIRHVAMTSNGFRLKQQVGDWAAAGLDSLNISIDSLDPRLFASITGHDKLADILSGIDQALSLGLKVKVNAVLMRQYNADDLIQFTEWVRTTPVTLRLIELMQTGDNLEFFERNHVSGQTVKQHLEAQGWCQKLRESTAGPALEYTHPDYAGGIGLIMPYSKDFCTSCNRLRVSALGKLHLCLFAEHGIDIRQWLNTDKIDRLPDVLTREITAKSVSHWLDEGKTGATRHLSMLGG